MGEDAGVEVLQEGQGAREQRGEAHPRPRWCLLVLLPLVTQTQTGGSRHKLRGKGKALLSTMCPLVFPGQGSPYRLQN